MNEYIDTEPASILLNSCSANFGSNGSGFIAELLWLNLWLVWDLTICPKSSLWPLPLLFPSPAYATTACDLIHTTIARAQSRFPNCLFFADDCILSLIGDGMQVTDTGASRPTSWPLCPGLLPGGSISTSEGDRLLLVPAPSCQARLMEWKHQTRAQQNIPLNCD